MKKGDIIQVYIEEEKYPDKGIGYIDGQKVVIEDCFKDQGIEARINKKNTRQILARKLSVIKKAEYEQEAFCDHYGKCGGCGFQILPYSKQLERKGREVIHQLKANEIRYEEFLGVESSVRQLAYRNKMEYTFGDEMPDGEMTLGMHKKKQYMSVITTDECKIVPHVFNRILAETLSFCQEKQYPIYHKKTHTGLMRNLILRRGEKTGEILVNIVTSTQVEFNEKEYAERILALHENREVLTADLTAGQNLPQIDLKTEQSRPETMIIGILHTTSDNPADAVNPESVKILWGRDYFYDEIMGLKFKISPFSFFQPNTLTAEKLYAQTLAFAGDLQGKTVFDLYSGTGTISQVMALKAEKVIGIELIGEAVEAAKENARLNNLENCAFVAGDVFKVLDGLDAGDQEAASIERVKPDVIVVDPPRAGILPKALEQILSYDVPRIVYISCNPLTLAANLSTMQERGYQVKAVKVFDQFPHTKHVECVVLMSKASE